jgi:hypothetical protein
MQELIKKTGGDPNAILPGDGPMDDQSRQRIEAEVGQVVIIFLHRYSFNFTLQVRAKNAKQREEELKRRAEQVRGPSVSHIVSTLRMFSGATCRLVSWTT